MTASVSPGSHGIQWWGVSSGWPDVGQGVTVNHGGLVVTGGVTLKSDGLVVNQGVSL